MSKLQDLLDQTNENTVKGWAFRTDDNGETFKLLEVGAIKTEEGTEDALAAVIHDMEGFMKFLEEETKAARQP